MKHTENPTRSTYLLEKANPFVLYPNRIYGRHSKAVRKVNDEMRRKMIEWRKTFAPEPESENTILKILGNPTSLDELYCRELLKAIPKIVERTLALSHLTLAGISESEFRILTGSCKLLLFWVRASRRGAGSRSRRRGVSQKATERFSPERCYESKAQSNHR
jgi:hypothetical protein